jgi:RimJ/RimL family protein N-acetyltransferase
MSHQAGPNGHHLSFPQILHLHDGTEATQRPMAVSDGPALRTFYEAVPAGERLMLQEDILAPGAIDRVIADMESGRVTPILAFHEDRVVAHGALARRLHGWTRRVGFVRVIVHPDYRRLGLAGFVLRTMVDLAAQVGLDKVMAEVLADQRRERRLLESLGFRKEALLKDHATDLRGHPHNVVLYSNSVLELWRKMEDMILDAEFEVIP